MQTKKWYEKYAVLIFTTFAIVFGAEIFFIYKIKKHKQAKTLTQITSTPIAVNSNFTPKDLAVITQTPTTHTKQLSIGFQPATNLAELKSVTDELAKLVSTKVHEPVKAVISSTYNDLFEGIKNGQIDVAIMTSVVFLRNKLSTNIIPVLRVLRNGKYSDRHFSAIITNPDNKNINSLKDICGKKVGFVEVDSTSGYIYPKHKILKYLEENKLTKCKFASEVFLGSHKNVLDALVKKEIDIGAVFSNNLDGTEGAWSQLGNYKIKAIAYSEPILNEAVFINKSLDVKTKALLVASLQEISTTPTGKNIFGKIARIEGFSAVKPMDYENDEAILQEFDRLSAKYGNNPQK